MAVQFWDDLRGETESLSATLRNVGLLGAAPLAFFVAVWRGASAHRSADAGHAALLNERYQRAAEMLANELLVTRLGGIYALGDLAEDYPEAYHVRCMSLLCAFLRSHQETTPEDERSVDLNGSSIPFPPAEDIRTAAEYVAYRHSPGRIHNWSDGESHQPNRLHSRVTDIEKAAGYVPDLSGASLRRLQLWQAQLTGARFQDTDLRHTVLVGGDMSNSDFALANMNGAFLADADMSGANFHLADMTEVVAARANLAGSRLAEKMAGARLGFADLYEARFGACDLTDANLAGANLSGATFEPDAGVASLESEATKRARLTQRQLDEAVADPSRPPRFAEGTLDIETGEPLTWNGGSELRPRLALKDGRYQRKRQQPAANKAKTKTRK